MIYVIKFNKVDINKGFIDLFKGFIDLFKVLIDLCTPMLFSFKFKQHSLMKQYVVALLAVVLVFQAIAYTEGNCKPDEKEYGGRYDDKNGCFTSKFSHS